MNTMRNQKCAIYYYWNAHTRSACMQSTIRAIGGGGEHNVPGVLYSTTTLLSLLATVCDSTIFMRFFMHKNTGTGARAHPARSFVGRVPRRGRAVGPRRIPLLLLLLPLHHRVQLQGM